MSECIRASWWAVLLVGCSLSGIDPTPFLGASPRSILVAPIVDLSMHPGLSDSFMAGLPAQLRDRGYYVYPTDTGLSWLPGEESTVEDVLGVAREFQQDSVLIVTVLTWDAVFGRVLESLNYDVGYQILSVFDGRVIWEHQAVGGYLRQMERLSMDDRYLGPSFEPSMADLSVNYRFQNNASVASALSRTVFQHLPVAPDVQ